MKKFENLPHHPLTEQMVDILCERTQNKDRLFFRLLCSYFWSVLASSMRTNVIAPDQRKVPVNAYIINLAPSGFGKGYSTSIMEEEVIEKFRVKFLNEIFPKMAEQHLPTVALERCERKDTDMEDELEQTKHEFDMQGPAVFSFDSATVPAVRQAHHKCLMANAGALNLQIDEIGSNLLGNSEILTPYLELFDLGKIKQKLLKNTGESSRVDPVGGRTPANMLLFGTPSRLLDGSRREEELYAMLDEGYARRCFFGYTKIHERDRKMTAQELLDLRQDPAAVQFMEDLSEQLESICDMMYAHRDIALDDAVALKLTEYQLYCEDRAEAMAEHDEIRKAEMSHRHMKVMKVAGAITWLEGHLIMEEEHLDAAIRLAEDSGEAFNKLLTRDRPYAKLAHYIADVPVPVTQPDLVEDLPFYKGTVSAKQEMLNMAIAYGYKNNILIKNAYTDGVQFISGERLERTDQDKMIVSYSADIVKNYQKEFAPFNKLHNLTQLPGYHWCNHAFSGGYRDEDHTIEGFNLIVFDVDKGVSLEIAKNLLSGYKALFYTTKRHRVGGHDRFRVIIPTNFVLKLNNDDYKAFMKNLMEWLPFDSDEQVGQRARKWLSHNGTYEYIDGEPLDVLPFIPETAKNDKLRILLDSQTSMDNLERWVINNSGDGNRNHMLLRYAMILVDAHYGVEAVRAKVKELNSKLPSKLEDSEIDQTIMVTVAKKADY